MKLLDFFKRPFFGIFVDSSVKGKGVFDNVKTDYVLSRALYTSAPVGDDYLQYALGNYCTKTYIDTFSSFVGLPDITSASDDFTASIQAFLLKEKPTLIRIYRQTMIDGTHYVWARIENDIKGMPKLKLKQIPFENVVEKDCIKTIDGVYKKFVIETVEKWIKGGDEKTAIVRIELEPGKETITIDGDLPPQYSKGQDVILTSFNFVPVFCLYNNKLTFMKDGIPEIAPVVPFIRRYDATLRIIGKHIDNILDPKMKIKVENADNFLKRSFGLSAAEYAKAVSGELTVDITQFKAAMLANKDDDLEFITQQDNTQSAIELLKLLHWIIVELTMPEYLYGTAMNSTNASVKEQSPVWTKKVEDRQSDYNEFYYWLADIFYLAQTAINGRDIYAQDGGAGKVLVRWAELTAKDDVAVMNALSTFVGAMDKAMTLGLISPQTAFNTMKTFISIPNDYEDEKKAAAEWIKLKLRIESIQDRIRSGDVDAEDAINELFSREAA
ncbi:hypothetical protein [Treponema phagedenis]|uniref:hypothetical protein n=1 Tax=Treponema phagedenis TaxID=162 RepID=UPI0011E7FF16|nr:hypothetical protein [Treponema phagedenis]QEJ95344.1 hypothetical protein FUT79_09090 [Treponema phagedenis]QEK06207.1 hypothetical protein FUT80_05460 [Treponema phagedenis]